jgi:CO/xanthine dehydrogenase Mo-binding subunit
MTSHAMMVAEELEVDPSELEVVFAEGVGGDYRNPALGVQLTGGSTSVSGSWVTLRTAAATAREMLRAAAARSWGVPSEDIVASGGVLSHAASKRSAGYGEFATAAAREDVGTPTLKAPSEFKVLGKSVPRVDLKTKILGTAIFGIDATVPGMLHAFVVRSPTLGGKPRAFNDSAALKSAGVQATVALPNGVAIVATHWYQAKKAASLLEVDWDAGPLASLSTETLFAEYRNTAAGEGKKARAEGDVDAGFATPGAKIVEAVYETPFLAHATMEPQNCVAHVTADACEVWAPTQGPQLAREVAAKVTGLPHAKIRVHQTFLGGGFGRRIAQDYVEEAVRVSQALLKPVKVVWSREDDTRHDFYRPAAVTSIRGAVDATGRPVAWRAHVVTQSILSQVVPEFLASMLPTWVPQGLKNFGGGLAGRAFKGLLVDDTAVEGAATMPYAIPNMRVEYTPMDPGVPVGFWRSVGHSFNAFVTEGFVNELAHAAGKDPLAFRRDLLADKPRHLAVLELAATKAGWGTPAGTGVHRGIAVAESFGSRVAHVVEASVEGGAIRVVRVVSAVDCGFVVNPDIVAAQVESSVVFALGAALKQRIDIDSGRVRQGNFHEFQLLRQNECPVIEVHLVPSGDAPTGIGEPAVPPLAPALAEAVFAATGQRMRAMPFVLG